MDYLNINNATRPYDNYSNTVTPKTDEAKPSDKKEDEPVNPAMPGRTNPEECKTCKERKYQDASDEGNVSFKNAAHVSPTAAGAAVRAHENMHVTNAYNKAKEADGKVVSAYVTIKTSVCPECGRTYVAGGNTHTQIRYPNQSNPYQKERMAEDAANLTGKRADFMA